MQKFGYTMNCPGCRSVMMNTTARAHTEECRKKLDSCLAEDEETKLRSEAAKLRVDNWLASRVESTPRSGDAMSYKPSGAASSSAPAAAASRSVPTSVSCSSADERFRSDEIPDHGVKRVRWSPHEQDTKEFESSVQIPSQEHSRGLKRQPDSTTEDLEDAGDQENREDAHDDDMKALGAVFEEPVITIGSMVKRWTNVRMAKSPTSTTSMVAFWILKWSGRHVWKSWLDTSRCRCIVVSQLLRLVLTK